MKPVSNLIKWALLVVAAGVLLTACSDFDEMKSQKLYSQAQHLFEQGQEGEAEALLDQLVDRYPRTQVAPLASRQLAQLRHRREMHERQSFAKVLDSYRQVLNGYYSVYAQYPQSFAELDDSDYFFDTNYLAEVTGDEVKVYLVLTGDAGGFRVWGVKSDNVRGYALDGQSKVLVPFNRDETLQYLEERYQVVEQKGQLVLLQPKS